jgi:YHS domain-containing protein
MVAKDPVCGMELREEMAPSCTEFAGKTYCFCSETCRMRFETQPERYVAEPAA